jgi:RHS repeat-associated protein
MPVPESVMISCASRPRTRAWADTAPPWGVYLMALSSKMSAACSIIRRSPSTIASASARSSIAIAFSRASGSILRASIIYPSTHQVSYGYNARGELETVTDWLSDVTTYSYDPAGRLTEIEYPNGVVGTRDYDDADRLTEIAYADGMTALETISYVVNEVGIRTSMMDSTGTTDYTYDALYRLTEVEYPNSDVTEYGYDAVGNRTSLTINGGTPIANTYSAANELTASGSDSFSYDENGNLTSKTVSSVTTDYTWDALNRMTGIDDGATVASYVYNGTGRRVAKSVNSVMTEYTWDPIRLGQVISDGNEYVWAGFGDLVSRVTSGGSSIYAHQDGLGSVRLLTDSAASMVGTEEFDVFGATRAQSGTQILFSYAGSMRDSEFALPYLRARSMDVIQGRFVSRDPYSGNLSNVASLHRYSYVANDPVNMIDPSGLCKESSGGGGSDQPPPDNCFQETLDDVWIARFPVIIACILCGLPTSGKVFAVPRELVKRGGCTACFKLAPTAFGFWLVGEIAITDCTIYPEVLSEVNPNFRTVG